jgi:hypothetical protein
MRFDALLPLMLLMAITTGGTAMGQEPTPNPDEVQKQIDAVKKQTELVNAQKELLDAQKGLVGAQKAMTSEASQVADQVAAANAAKSVADAQKALADAKKAQADASTAAFKSSIGEIPTSGYTGSVDLKTSAGEIEAALLAVKAAGEAAERIDEAVRSSLKANSTVVVAAAGDVPTFQNLALYCNQIGIINNALREALKQSLEVEPRQKQILESVPLVAGAGLVLDAMNKLLSYVRSDYTVGGVSLTLDDTVAVVQVADLLRRASGEGASKKEFTVMVPGVYSRQALLDAGNIVIQDLTALSATRQDADRLATLHDAEAEKLTKAASAEKDPAQMKALQDQAGKRKAAADALRKAGTTFDTWFGKLTAVDDKGASSLAMIVKEKAISDQLAGPAAALLLLKVQKAGGGYLVKKNMWTFFGGMPLYHMGGAVVSYVLLAGPTSQVLAAGAVPIHGGFVKAGNLRRELSQ